MKMKERFHAVCRFLNMISQGNQDHQGENL